MANFTFIEKSHQRVPMWNVFGDLKVLEGASLSVINTYMNTPTDNYNIYFKGSNQKFILDNPKYINIYTKNANVVYTNNPVEFSFKFSRINMWIYALDYLNACNECYFVMTILNHQSNAQDTPTHINTPL